MNFTNEEKEQLLSNKYTKYVGDKTIKFTDSFWIEFENRLSEGKNKKVICRELGYDPELIGTKRLEYIVTTINSSHKSETEAIKKMEKELTYLRQEIEFIKRITFGDFSNKS